MTSQIESYETYKKFATAILDLFDSGWDKYGRKVESGWPFLKHIPTVAYKPMIQLAVDRWDSMPRNWVKNIKEIYESWRSESHHSAVVYNREYDDRFPVEKMHEAYDILSVKGNEAFNRFCDAEHMPLSDRDRVVMKYRVVTGDFKIDTGRIKTQIGNVTGSHKQVNKAEKLEILKRQRNEILQREPGWEPEEEELPF